MSLVQLGRGMSLRAQKKQKNPSPLFSYDVSLGDTITDISLAQAGGNLDQGTVLFSYEDLTAQTGAVGNTFILNIGNENWSEAISIYKAKTTGYINVVVRSGNAYEIRNFMDAQAIPEQEVKMAISWTQGKVAFFINGVRFLEETSYTFPSDFADGIRFGSRENDLYPITGTTPKTAMFWTEALSDRYLEALTTTTEIIGGVTNDATLDVVAFLGQSNAVGQGELASAPTYKNPAFIKMIGQDGVLKGYDDPYDDPTGSIIPKMDDGAYGVSYAGTVIDGLATAQQKPIAALCCAVGGTSIANDWNLEFSVSATRKISPSIAMAAIHQLRLANQHGNLKVIVYHQGESDASIGTTGLEYQAGLHLLFARLQREFKSVPIILVSLHEWHVGTGISETNWNDIKQAQDSFSRGGVYVVPAAGKSAKLGDEKHLDVAGLLSLGTDISDKIYDISNPLNVFVSTDGSERTFDATGVDYISNAGGFITLRFTSNNEPTSNEYPLILDDGSTANVMGLRLYASQPYAGYWIRGNSINIESTHMASTGVPAFTYGAEMTVGLAWNNITGQAYISAEGYIKNMDISAEDILNLNRLSVVSRSGSNPLDGTVHSFEIGSKYITPSEMAIRLV